MKGFLSDLELGLLKNRHDILPPQSRDDLTDDLKETTSLL